MTRSGLRVLHICGSLMACSPERAPKAAEDTHATVPPLPDAAETGPYVAATRDDQINTSSGQALRVQSWYPADTSATGNAHVYNDIITGTALDGAAPSCHAPRPVVLFSHGNGGIRFQSLFLTEHLATRGWVVVAPDHEGNTAFDLDSERAGEHAIRRPRDISETFDWLITELAGPGGPLDGCVDPEAGYAVMGHSFGGYTAIAMTSATLTAAHAGTCAPGWLCADTADWLLAHPEEDPAELVDARVWASVPMTPAAHELLSSTLGGNTVPTLILGGTFDTLTTMEGQVQPIYDGLGGEKYIATIDTAGHYTFSDLCTLIPTYEDCAAPFMPLAQAHRLIRGMTTAFVERQAGLADDSETWLPPSDPMVAWQADRPAD